MNTQSISHAHSLASGSDLRPWNLIEWQNSSSGTQWERFRDSGTASSARDFGDSPFRIWRLGIVTALVLVAIAVLWVLVGPWRTPSQVVTAAGEHRDLTLADGSRLHLNMNSNARIALSNQERRVILARGEARITVARETERPFRISTPQATVEGMGGVFNVSAAGGRTVVTVLEGRAIVLPPVLDERSGLATSPPRLLSAGQRALVTEEGEVSIRR